MHGLGFYIPAVVGIAIFAFKLPDLLRARHDPLLRAVEALLLVASAVWAFAAPPTIAAVNRLTGIPNFSAPLVYCTLTAFCASCLILLITWRGEDPERTRRATRWVFGVYSTVIVVLLVLFALADAPVERLRDLDTYYATTPFMREMIVLYLLAHTAAVVITTVMCWRWSKRVQGWLRAGLVLIVIGYFGNIGYDVAKFGAVAARWSGRDRDWLSTDLAPPLAFVSALFIGAGFLLPLIGQRLQARWRDEHTYRRLGPLLRELRTATPERDAPEMVPAWARAELRLTYREAGIHDHILLLNPYFDRAVREQTARAARLQRLSGDQVWAIGTAAMLVDAVGARIADPEGRVLGAAEAYGPESIERLDDLVRVSHALRHPLVSAVRRTRPHRRTPTPHPR
ncbi:MAB_1171c family putative transporter [Streptomyces sp. NPDC005963]|uniref:MAB_1171c family putative transporter n=1 Tax=Streptomyces sp. NPDC005963 TaxID=3156721 RepID=UPI0034010FA5